MNTLYIVLIFSSVVSGFIGGHLIRGPFSIFWAIVSPFLLCGFLFIGGWLQKLIDKK